MKNAVFITSLISLTTATVCLNKNAVADWSALGQIASDYTFNGVSQTQHNPALQIGLDYSDEAGWYAGTWGSNVDFGSGDDTRAEADVYAGYYRQLTDSLGLDSGIAYYTYHGASNSSNYNYPEIYAKFNHENALGTSEVNFWYSWDYFGLEADHSIVMLAHSLEISPGHVIRFSADRSNSYDRDLWSWNGDSHFYHWRVAYQTSFSGFDVSVAAEDTNMDMYTADARIVAQIGKTLSL